MAQPAPAPDFPLEKIHAAYRFSRLITLSIAATLPVYAIIVEILRHQLPPVVTMTNLSMVRISFFALAGVFIFTATVIKGLMLRAAPATPEARLARLRVASVAAAAIAEGPAAMGVVFYVITHRRGDFYVLLVVSAYLLVRHFPQQAAWEAYVRRGGDAR